MNIGNVVEFSDGHFEVDILNNDGTVMKTVGVTACPKSNPTPSDKKAHLIAELTAMKSSISISKTDITRTVNLKSV